MNDDKSGSHEIKVGNLVVNNRLPNASNRAALALLPTPGLSRRNLLRVYSRAGTSAHAF